MCTYHKYIIDRQPLNLNYIQENDKCQNCMCTYHKYIIDRQPLNLNYMQENDKCQNCMCTYHNRQIHNRQTTTKPKLHTRVTNVRIACVYTYHNRQIHYRQTTTKPKFLSSVGYSWSHILRVSKTPQGEVHRVQHHHTHSNLPVILKTVPSG